MDTDPLYNLKDIMFSKATLHKATTTLATELSFNNEQISVMFGGISKEMWTQIDRSIVFKKYERKAAFAWLLILKLAAQTAKANENTHVVEGIQELHDDIEKLTKNILSTVSEDEIKKSYKNLEAVSIKIE